MLFMKGKNKERSVRDRQFSIGCDRYNVTDVEQESSVISECLFHSYVTNQSLF